MKRFLLFFITLFTLNLLWAQSPATWTFDHESLGDDEFELIFKASLEDGGYIYAQDNEGSKAIVFEFSDNVQLLGETTESGQLLAGDDPHFKDKASKRLTGQDIIFRQKIRLKDDSKPVNGQISFLAANEVKCFAPVKLDFQFDLKLTNTALLGKVEKRSPYQSNDFQKILVSGDNDGSGEYSNYVKELLKKDEIDTKNEALITGLANPKGNCGDDKEKSKNYFWIFFGGFLGGFVALLTPCVFPMIPLTVSYFTKSSDSKAAGIRNALIYGASIIVIYVTIGLALTAALGPTGLNDLSTQWLPNVIFFLIFIFFAFSFFGYYEITLPSSWTNKSDSIANKGGVLGIFFMAFTLALVSFSCTGPIIGSALVQSATDFWGPFFVMLGFSSALALPFGLFAAFPGWLNSLPRSGGWMTTVKVVLGFLELALAFKFLSVADMTNHWGILKYETFLGIWVIVSALMAIYLFGLIHFPHDNPKAKISIPRRVIAVAVAAFTVYLCTGFMIDSKTKSYSSIPILSGLVPPPNYNIFLPEPSVDPIIKAKYPSFTKCANDLDCFKDYYEGLAYAKEVGKPILLDFTGYGCVNCRKTEDQIWKDNRVWSQINDQLVLISLYVDDKKELPKRMKSANAEGKLRTVGAIWADFQVTNFGETSQPLYVVIDPDQNILSKPRGYQSSVIGYKDYLNCGLNAFNGNNGGIGSK